MPEPELSATFPFSNDDLADVTLRHLHRNQAWRRQRWLKSLGLATFALVVASLLLVLLPTESAFLRWALPISCALGTSAAFALHWPRATRSAIIRWLQRQHGPGPHTCTVTLSADGVQWLQMGETAAVPWHTFRTIRRTGDDIELAGDRILVVRRRAFADDAGRDRFLAAAERLHVGASVRA